jgi:hypothetical protein
MPAKTYPVHRVMPDDERVCVSMFADAADTARCRRIANELALGFDFVGATPVPASFAVRITPVIEFDEEAQGCPATA